MKNMEEMIAVMQAYKNGKEIQTKLKKRDIWEDCSPEEPQWDWASFDYRVKPERHLPTTWEEFCETHPTKRGEVFINNSSLIREYTGGEHRDAEGDKNLLSSKEYAEALLALCQLIQLRDCYNEGWQPDWKSDCLKYTIQYYEDKLQALSAYKSKQILTFETEELRDEFLENFKDLIEIAKPLL